MRLQTKTDDMQYQRTELHTFITQTQRINERPLQPTRLDWQQVLDTLWPRPDLGVTSTAISVWHR
jgi:hypothetical protein